MRKRTWIIAGIAITAVTVAVYAYREYHRTNKSLTEVKADAEVDAVALVNEFLANDSIAYNKYRNKILAVQGMVKAVDTAEGDCTVVLGDTTEMASAVRCLVDSSFVQHAMAFKRGEQVTIKGAITGFKKDETGLLGSDVELNRCVVADKP